MIPYDFYPTLLLIHLAVTMFMVGVIWFVQVVHYPLLGHVGETEFPSYEALHIKQTGKVVMPAMVLEFSAACLLALEPASANHHLLSTTGFALLLFIWASTALLQVPAHTILRQGFHEPTHRKLVRTNWIRTLLWTTRAGLALAMFYP